MKAHAVKKKKATKKKKEQVARPLLTLAGMPLVAHLVRSHWKALTLPADRARPEARERLAALPQAHRPQGPAAT